MPRSSPDPKNLRRQIIVMRKMQGQLLFRIMIYSCLSSVVASIVCCAGSNIIANVLTALVGYQVPHSVAIIVSLLLSLVAVIPITLYDAAKLSSRMLAPLVRAQGVIRRLGNDEIIRPLEARDDTWSDWIRDFNVMVSRVQNRLGSQSGATQ